MYDFQERIDSQKEYYEQFKDWLAGQKNVARVWDADFEDDLKGTDLFFETINGDVFAVQVKVYHRADGSGNLPFETILQAYGSRNSVIGSIFNMSHVHYIFFVLSASKTVIGFGVSSILNFIIEHYREFRNYRSDNREYATLGILVPKCEIEHLAQFNGNLHDFRGNADIR